MKIPLLRLLLLLSITISIGSGLSAQDEKPQSEEKQESVSVAIFVRNRAGAEFEKRMPGYEDRIIAAVASKGFRVISQEDVLKSTTPGEVEKAFAEQTTAVRLAQNIGADYLLMVSLVDFGQDEQLFDGYGVTTKNVISKMESTYRIVTLVKGAGVTGASVEVSETTRQTPNAQKTSQAVVGNLLAKSAKELGAKITEAVEQGKLPSKEELPVPIPVYIIATIQDLNIPDVVKGEDGQYKFTANTYKLEVFGANVEVNGLTVGTTSQDTPIMVSPGINRLKISRPGYQSVERMVSFSENQVLQIPMVMNQEGMVRMKEMTTLFQSMKKDAALTDAEVKKIEGEAKMLEQSGIRVDRKEDTKVHVETDQPLQIKNVENSLFK